MIGELFSGPERTLEQLVVLSNLESINALLLHQRKPGG